MCRTVADLYVFLCQHLIAAKDGDASMIDEIPLVLETEAETWRMVVREQRERAGTFPSCPRVRTIQSVRLLWVRARRLGGLNLQGYGPPGEWNRFSIF